MKRDSAPDVASLSLPHLQCQVSAGKQKRPHVGGAISSGAAALGLATPRTAALIRAAIKPAKTVAAMLTD